MVAVTASEVYWSKNRMTPISQVRNWALPGVVTLALFCSHSIRPWTAPETCISLIMPPMRMAKRMIFTFQPLLTTPISLSKLMPRAEIGLPPARIMHAEKMPTNMPTKIFRVSRHTMIVSMVGIRIIQEFIVYRPFSFSLFFAIFLQQRGGC